MKKKKEIILIILLILDLITIILIWNLWKDNKAPILKYNPPPPIKLKPEEDKLKKGNRFDFNANIKKMFQIIFTDSKDIFIPYYLEIIPTEQRISKTKLKDYIDDFNDDTKKLYNTFDEDWKVSLIIDFSRGLSSLKKSNIINNKLISDLYSYEIFRDRIINNLKEKENKALKNITFKYVLFMQTETNDFQIIFDEKSTIEEFAN